MAVWGTVVVQVLVGLLVEWLLQHRLLLQLTQAALSMAIDRHKVRAELGVAPPSIRGIQRREKDHSWAAPKETRQTPPVELPAKYILSPA